MSRPTSFLCFGVLALCLALASAGPQSAEEQRNYDLLNWWRATNGRAGLIWHDQLAQAARDHACDMGRRGYYSHVTPEGVDWEERARRAGYGEPGQEFCTCDINCQNCDWNRRCPNGDYLCCRGASAAGENIAAGWRDADNTFAQWQSSPPHNQNMLDPLFRSVGIGFCYTPGSRWRWYWVQLFGSHSCAGRGMKRSILNETTYGRPWNTEHSSFLQPVCAEDGSGCVL
jgi:uncharacterized protein YkwD